MSGDYQIKTIDREVLPAAMLDLAKQHMRVTFDTDDEYIKNCLWRAIDEFERITGQRVFAAVLDWWPDITAAGWAYRTPLQPVSAFTFESPPGTDLKADYELRYTDIAAPFYLASIAEEPWPADAVITLTAGYADFDKMEPGIVDCVLRMAAMLYEYRETVSALSLSHVPGWPNALLTAYWLPRV